MVIFGGNTKTKHFEVTLSSYLAISLSLWIFMYLSIRNFFLSIYSYVFNFVGPV